MSYQIEFQEIAMKMKQYPKNTFFIFTGKQFANKWRITKAFPTTLCVWGSETKIRKYLKDKNVIVIKMINIAPEWSTISLNPNDIMEKTSIIRDWEARFIGYKEAKIIIENNDEITDGE